MEEFDSKSLPNTYPGCGKVTEFKNGKEAHSKSYDEVVKAAIDYSIYSKKELYISANSKKQVYDESVAIPESFYDFRNNYDLGNESLRNYYPYGLQSAEPIYIHGGRFFAISHPI